MEQQSEQDQMKTEIVARGIREDQRRAEIRFDVRMCLGIIGGFVVVAAVVVWLSFVLPSGTNHEPTPSGEGVIDRTLTITAPLRVEGLDNAYFSDSIIVTLSKSLADEDWVPVLSGGACHVLSPGANTHFIGADGVQVTSFDQTIATHIILTQDEDDIDCDLEYAVPAPTRGTFTTTVDLGE